MPYAFLCISDKCESNEKNKLVLIICMIAHEREEQGKEANPGAKYKVGGSEVIKNASLKFKA